MRNSPLDQNLFLKVYRIVLELLAERCEGNPLYATYLSRELSNRLRAGTVASAEDWLQEAPVIAGNIAEYYAYLYKHASETAQAIADVLGVIDFGVSEADLREILPSPLRRWISSALEHLNPILTTISSQGGVRIFHESFRRFMTEELARQERLVADALNPVIDWLKARGFFCDAKAYRFLLPALRRAGRIDEALTMIDASFVSKSVAHGHSVEAVERNLAITVDMAAHTLRWADLVRCAELNRSAQICFEEKLDNPIPYWTTYLDLFGPEALVERLLFDGRTTQKCGLGLILCSMADDAGATPPWREYLHEYINLSTGDESDERISLAKIHGLIRVEGFDAISESLLKFLIEHGEHHARPKYVCALGERVARSAGREAVEKIITLGTEPTGASATLAPRIVALLRLGLAEALEKAGDRNGAAEAAHAAVGDIGSPELAVTCLHLGAFPSEAAVHAVPPSTLSLSLGGYPSDAGPIRTWVASIRLLAGVDQAALDAERTRIEGEGWYRCWLRFVIALAEIEAAKRIGQTSLDVRAAFKELSADVRPFAGKPRPCDLYCIQGLVVETLKWGMSLLDTQEQWAAALDDLYKVLDGTSVSFQRMPSGPILFETVMEILLPYSERSDIAPMIRSFAETLISDSEAVGTYFECHAEHSMLLARVFKAVGDVTVAHATWDRVGVYLGGYGQRKDITCQGS